MSSNIRNKYTTLIRAYKWRCVKYDEIKSKTPFEKYPSFQNIFLSTVLTDSLKTGDTVWLPDNFKH